MKILVIDDDKDITEVFKIFFEKNSMDCHTENDGKKGLERIQNEDYDIILLDLAIPNFSGKDIIDSLENNGLINRKKIIIITASAISDKEHKYYVEKGVKAFIKKPFDISKLKDIILNVANMP
ncbi:MAG: response regulator transcription factor [Thaumarchaeota archaeon]|nr:response regulator transcription factor [Nitrososphaerota archaeon]